MNKNWKTIISSGAKNNIIMQASYFISYPIVLCFKFFKISPNYITLLSFILSLFSCIFLWNGFVHLFLTSFIISYVLDYVDGSLARISGKLNNRAVCPDHYSDQVKIILLFLSFGIYYNEKFFWILSFLSSTFFLLYSLLNHELGRLRENTSDNNNKNSNGDFKSSSISRFISLIKSVKFCKHIFALIFTINGHTILFFSLIPFSSKYSSVFMLYFLSLSFLLALRAFIYLYLKRLKY